VTIQALDGRKPIVTPERVQVICELLANGESETAACRRAGIGLPPGARLNELARITSDAHDELGLMRWLWPFGFARR